MKKYLVVVLFASLLLSCGCTKNKTQPITGFSPIETTQAGVSETKQEVTYTIPQTIKTYYKEIDFSKSSMALQEDLSQLTTKQHRHHLTYNELWDVLKVTDLTPAANEVYLLYGERGILQGKKAYTKGKNQNGGRQNQWNREHTYARSLGTPKLEQSSTGANEDAHHIRPADVQWNAQRGNKKFAQGSGIAGDVQGGWYPGDDWKGDVARMMLYMYLRYPSQCLPTNVAVGEKNDRDAHMVNILLQWNAEDPVSAIEIQRNEYLSKPEIQGNRNPFIDNPHLATQLWGGPVAENRW
ncbi:endonuclease I family protein [Myroides odoratus]|uniref:endonuclease I family protein n=1 Tax=Myroides odoratus TaxID=256 RepID=UPI000765866D|nr:endonuclease [Myroides odoratus]